MKTRLIFVFMTVLLIAAHEVTANQTGDIQRRVKSLREELILTTEQSRQIELKQEIARLTIGDERREPLGRLDQGGEDWSDAAILPPDPSISASGTTVGFANDFDVSDLEYPPNPCWQGYFDQVLSCAGPDVAYRYTVPVEGTYRISLCNGPLYDSGLLVYVYTGGPPSNFTDLICGNDDFCNLTSELVTPVLPAGLELLIVVDGWNVSAGDYQIDIELTELSIPPNDICLNPQLIEPFAPVTGTTIDATLDTAPLCGTSISAPGVWYAIVGTGNTMTAHTCFGADYDTKLNVYFGPCEELSCVGGNDDACGVQSSVTWCSTSGETYYILVQGFGGATGNFTLVVEDDGLPCALPVLSIREVYEQLPSLIGQTISVIGHASNADQGILVDTWHEHFRNEDHDPNTIIEVSGADAWTVYIPPVFWEGEEIIVTGVINTEPTSPAGYEATIEINDDAAPAAVNPPPYQFNQPNWRPANWPVNPTCDTCNFGILISGGIDNNANRADYWEDLVDYFCFKKSIGYCESGLKVFYADGTRRDNRIPAGNVATCTQAEIQAHINALAAKITACKNRAAPLNKAKVEVMSSNHGKKGPNGGLHTWGRTNGAGNYISPATFTNMMQSLIDAGATEMEIEMGQCYGGQMIDNLRNNLDSKGAKVTAASAAPDSLPSVSQSGVGGFNRWLNPLLCARYNGASLPDAIRQANQSYDAVLDEYGDYYTAWAAYKDVQGNHADSVKAEKYRRYARQDTNARGGETAWYKIPLNQRCQGDTIAVTPGGRLQFVFSGPAKSCGNCEIKCKDTNGDWISYRNWNWNVPGSAGYSTGNFLRTLDAGAGHTGLYVIHSRSDSFKVSVKAFNPPLSAILTTDPSNPETFAGFSVGWTSGNSDEFGSIASAIHVIPDVDDDGFNMSTSPKELGTGGVGVLIAEFDVLAENYWWTDMNLYMSVLNGTAGVNLHVECPDCEITSADYALSGGNEVFTLNLGSINQLGAHSLAISASGTTELDCWGLESARSTGIPPAVSDLVVIRDGDNVKLYWSAVPVAVSYLVQTATTDAGPWTDLGTSGVTEYIHTGQANAVDEQLYYQVIAVGP